MPLLFFDTILVWDYSVIASSVGLKQEASISELANVHPV